MMQLKIPAINAQRFTHLSGAKVLVSDISDIALSSFHRLYDDACDEGIALFNPKTNSVTRWYLWQTMRDADGDVSFWELKPTNETLWAHPATAGYTLNIFND